MIKDYAPRLRSLDEHDPDWNEDFNKSRGSIRVIKLILIAIIMIVLFIAVIKKSTAEPTLQPIDCLSLVDQNGEE